jgi:hypothetical protein
MPPVSLYISAGRSDVYDAESMPTYYAKSWRRVSQAM